MLTLLPQVPDQVELERQGLLGPGCSPRQQRGQPATCSISMPNRLCDAHHLLSPPPTFGRVLNARVAPPGPVTMMRGRRGSRYVTSASTRTGNLDRWRRSRRRSRGVHKFCSLDKWRPVRPLKRRDDQCAPRGANGGSSVVRRRNSYPPQSFRSYRGVLTNALDWRLTRKIPR
jgi:hypothetical protein